VFHADVIHPKGLDAQPGIHGSWRNEGIAKVARGVENLRRGACPFRFSGLFSRPGYCGCVCL